MRVERIGTVLFAAALVAAGFWGCGGDKNGTGGTGGTGATGGTGGTGASGGTGGKTTTSSGTTTKPSPTSTGTNGGESFLGLACAGDADCGMGGKCILPSDNDPLIGGGAANGYCTKLCTADADCPGDGSTCLDDMMGHKECFLGCTFGSPPLMYLNDPLDPTKCHGREDMRCQELADKSQVCLPTCGSDDECAGRQCDPRLAVCVDAPSMGKGTGEACDPKAMMTDCAGTCISIGADKSMCTSPCALGGTVDDTSFECGGLTKGVCLYSPMGSELGDVAFCAKSCTGHEECQAPAFFCFDLNIPSNGACLNSKECASDADCSNYNKAACVQTSEGKFCLSPKYPLGKFAPGGSSSSSTGTGTGGSGSSGSGGTGGMGSSGSGDVSGSSSSGM